MDKFEIFRAYGQLISFILIPLILIRACIEIKETREYVATVKLDLECKLLRDSILVVEAINNSDYLAEQPRANLAAWELDTAKNQIRPLTLKSFENSYTHKDYSFMINYTRLDTNRNFLGTLKLICRNCSTNHYWIHIDRSNKELSFTYFDEKKDIKLTLGDIKAYFTNQEKFLNSFFQDTSKRNPILYRDL